MNDERSSRSLTYRDAGVDIDAANEAKKRIKELARSTFNSSVLREIGSFGGLYRPDLSRYTSPVLVSSADGVGTKLKLAFLTGIHNTVGRDLVAHCTNDILVQGARPLFFMDYIAAGKLDAGVIESIVEGLAVECRVSQCVLLGGETAEMPDFYASGEYDLAGFIVGLAEEHKLYDPGQVQAGDVLIGLRSSGLHTNGYSLVRRLFFEMEKWTVDRHVEEFGRTLGEELLEPHRNYFPVLKEMIVSDDLSGMAHITGGGITENLNRVLPSHLSAEVERGSWEIPAVFRVIHERGGVPTEEMYRTLNLGIGMILLVKKDRLSRVEGFLQRQTERYYIIGEIVEGDGDVRYR